MIGGLLRGACVLVAVLGFVLAVVEFLEGDKVAAAAYLGCALGGMALREASSIRERLK